ncbi:MAG: hypothetical protein M3468_06245 [Acidobacteriota bacterium]|nr:hypothetical protein [Acidobacteriota bacterium]
MLSLLVGAGSGGREYVLGFTGERRLAGYSAYQRRQLRFTYALGLATGPTTKRPSSESWMKRFPLMSSP